MKKLLILVAAVLAMASCNTKSDNKASDTADAPVTNTEKQAEPEPEAPDFRAESLDGETIRLSTFGGRYIVLDFWGTWCGWCVKGIPTMRTYYEKYSDRMEIIGVDYGDEENALRDFVRDNEMRWTHVLNDEDDPDGSLVGLYGVTGFPTKIIISPEGTIVGRYEGEVPEFYQKLDELFK